MSMGDAQIEAAYQMSDACCGRREMMLSDRWSAMRAEKQLCSCARPTWKRKDKRLRLKEKVAWMR